MSGIPHHPSEDHRPDLGPGNDPRLPTAAPPPYASLPSPGPPPRPRHGRHGRFRGDLSYARSVARWPGSAARGLRRTGITLLAALAWAATLAVLAGLVLLVTDR